MTQYFNQSVLLTGEQKIANRIHDAISDYDRTHPDQLKRAAQVAEHIWWNANVDIKKAEKRGRQAERRYQNG